MAGTIEKKAISLLNAVEVSGRQVTRVIIDGRKIEVVFDRGETPTDEFDKLDMHHDKT